MTRADGHITGFRSADVKEQKLRIRVFPCYQPNLESGDGDWGETECFEERSSKNQPSTCPSGLIAVVFRVLASLLERLIRNSSKL